MRFRHKQQIDTGDHGDDVPKVHILSRRTACVRVGMNKLISFSTFGVLHLRAVVTDKNLVTRLK